MKDKIAELRSTAATVVCLGSHPNIIQSMLDYDYICGKNKPSVLAIVASNRKQERYFWGEGEVIIPVISRLQDLKDAQKKIVNCIINFQSGRRVLAGTKTALEEIPKLWLVSIFAEQVPELHATQILKMCKGKNITVAGPASVGILIPGVVKLGAIGGTQHEQFGKAKIFDKGNTAIISTSGGMVNELIHTVTSSNSRVSFALAVGGDRFPATSPAEAMLLAEADEETEQIVYFGELGGTDEYEIAELVKSGKITKDIIAYIAGTVANLFETPPQFGHAKAIAQTVDETAQAKRNALKEVNIMTLDSFGDLKPALVKKNTDAKLKPDSPDLITIGARKKHLIVSRISGDINNEPQLLGRDLLHMVKKSTFAGLVISMLLGKEVKSQKLIDFTDLVLRLAVDHGAYVAGAVNTIITARAGKDLVSSLASGILTIGPRFGGAINESARGWIEGVSSGVSANDFVEAHNTKGKLIPGIGHKKYRLDQPDPRLKLIHGLADESGKYLKYACEVESITTSKKSNLILNVDGAIAAVLLDLLVLELKYDEEALKELVDAEFFNALFVISRTVGFTAHYLDQRRNDEGLLRLTDKEVMYYVEEA